MKINDIFYSLQGEGKWIGKPNIFIRTTGCNLRCEYCDTKYAYFKGKSMTIQQILNEISSYNCKKICLTGGEPLLQPEIFQLISELIKRDYQLLLETNGSRDISNLKKNQKLIISMDIKCPSSKMDKEMVFENICLLESADQIKFIVNGMDDYNYSKKIIKKYKPKSEIFIQPVWNSDQKKIADLILKDGLEVKLGIQLHKILWGESLGK